MSSKLVQAIFIRHAESAANKGFAAESQEAIPLTARGQEQAVALAAMWIEAPTLIVTSSFLRARSTAYPTCARFPDVRLQEWPIHEFTYLEPSRWNGTTPADRRGAVAAYWETADPHHVDGPSAENFASLCDRVAQVHRRLCAADPDASVLLFSHQQFITAIRLFAENRLEPSAAGMSRFLQKCMQEPVANAAMVRIALD